MSKGLYDKMQEHLKDYHIVDCSIRSRDCVYISFQNEWGPDDENPDILCRVGFFYPKTETKWGYRAFTNFYKGKSCVIPHGPVVVVDFDGKLVSQVGETELGEGFIIEKGAIPIIGQVSIMSVKEIDGQAYAVGTLRSVFRRENSGTWTILSGNDRAVLKEENRQKRTLGFEDIDGFSAKDIYACGGKGDLCHYDGKRWKEIDCPTNQSLLSICCADNGKVYIGGRKGIIIEGRGDEWQVIEQLGNVRIESMAWYKDRLYLATSRGLFDYHNGCISREPHLYGLADSGGSEDSASNERIKKVLSAGGASDEAIEMADIALNSMDSPKTGILAPANMHTLSTDGELLLLGGSSKVAVFDGNEWRILYAPYGMDMGGSL